MLLVSRFAILFLLFTLVPCADAQSAAVIGGFGGGQSAYDGPDILGRGGPVSGRRGTEAVPIHVQASLNGTYDSNILGYSVDSSGNLRAISSVGVTADVSASGRKVWRRSFLGLDYSGNYSHFARQSLFNGTNHQLNLAWGTQIGQKLQINSQVGAATSNRFLGGQSAFQSSEFEFLSAPTQELFDARSYFAGASAGATYSLSSRQSFRVSGNGSSVRRRARGLVDMQSYGASGDYVPRLSRRTSMGFSYTFNHFDYSKVFGESDVHTLGGHFSRKVGRDWQFSGSLTGSDQSTVGVRSVALDPVLASLLGRGSGAEVFESNNLLYGYSASVVKRIRRSNASFSAQRAIIPGNGYFLTSINRTVSAGFSHSVSRDLAFNGNFGYSKLSSLGFTSGDFKGWTGGASATYKVSESIGVNTRYDWRTFDLQKTTFGRTGYRVSIGLTYFPAQGPAGLF